MYFLNKIWLEYALTRTNVMQKCELIRVINRVIASCLVNKNQAKDEESLKFEKLHLVGVEFYYTWCTPDKNASPVYLE